MKKTKPTAEQRVIVNDLDVTELQKVCRHNNVDDKTNICRICSKKITASVRKEMEEKDRQQLQRYRDEAQPQVNEDATLVAGQVIELHDKSRWRVEHVNASRAYILPLSAKTVTIQNKLTDEEATFKRTGRGESITPSLPGGARIISDAELSADEQERVDTMAKKTKTTKKAAEKRAPKGDIVFTFKHEHKRDDILPAGLFVLDAVKKIGSGTAEQIGRAISKTYKGTQKPTRMAAYWCNQFLRSGHVSAPKEQLHGRVLASLERGDLPVWLQNSREQKRARTSAKKAAKKAAKKVAKKTNGAAKRAKKTNGALPKKVRAKKAPAADIGAGLPPAAETASAQE